MQISLSFSSRGHSQALSHMDTTRGMRDAGRIKPKTMCPVPTPSKLANTGPGFGRCCPAAVLIKRHLLEPLAMAQPQCGGQDSHGVVLTVILCTTIPL